MFSKLRRARADLGTMNRLLPRAEQIAHSAAAERPGAEHLLLAALEFDDTQAQDVLGELGVTAHELQAAIAQQHTDALASIGITADDAAIDAALPAPRSAPKVYLAEGSLQDTFQRAVELAKRDKSTLRSGHILLATCDTEHGTLARALQQLGVDRHQLQSVTRRRLDQED